MLRTCFVFISLLSVIIAAYAIGMYGFGPGVANLPPVFRENFNTRPLVVAAHIFASATALLLGPLQFSARLRGRWPALHRMVGRVYLGAAVPIGGLAGLYMSCFAFGGIASTLGFGCLAVLWLYTALRGYITARSRNFSAHRRWMLRNYSLTFAAVTLRLYLVLSFYLETPFEVSYQLIAWLCWVPNLVVGECLAQTLSSPATQRPVNRPRPTVAQVEHSTAEDA
jgi:uncharacterized membrane protein